MKMKTVPIEMQTIDCQTGEIVEQRASLRFHLPKDSGDDERKERTYAVSVYGYGEVTYQAQSAAKARAKAYRQFCDAIARWDFHKFLINSRVWLVRGRS